MNIKSDDPSKIDSKEFRLKCSREIERFIDNPDAPEMDLKPTGYLTREIGLERIRIFNAASGQYRILTRRNAFFFINAPSPSVDENGRVTITTEMDQTFCKTETVHFRSRLAGFCSDNDFSEVEILKSEDQNRELLDFFESELANTCDLAWVFFNGHGNDNFELCFDEGRIPVLTFIEKVIELNKTNRSFESNLRPLPVQIILANCYGHAFDNTIAEKWITESNAYVYALSDKDGQNGPRLVRWLFKRQTPDRRSEHQALTDLAETVISLVSNPAYT